MAGHTSNVIMCLMGRWSLSVITLSSSLWVMIMLVYSQILAFIFVRRLFRLNSLAERDAVLIAAMTKMTLIALISIIGSVMLIFGLIICGLSGEQTPTVFVFVGIGSIL